MRGSFPADVVTTTRSAWDCKQKNLTYMPQLPGNCFYGLVRMRDHGKHSISSMKFQTPRTYPGSSQKKLAENIEQR